MSRRVSIGVVAPNYSVGVSEGDLDKARVLGEAVAGVGANLLVQSTVGVNSVILSSFEEIEGLSVCFSHAKREDEFRNVFKQNPDLVDFVVYCGDDRYVADFVFVRSSDIVLFFPGNHNEEFYFKTAIDFGKVIGVIGASSVMLEFWNILENVNYGNVLFNKDPRELVENLVMQI